MKMMDGEFFSASSKALRRLDSDSPAWHRPSPVPDEAPWTLIGQRRGATSGQRRGQPRQRRRAHQLGHDLGTVDEEEEGARLVRDRARNERLARAGRAEHQDT